MDTVQKVNKMCHWPGKLKIHRSDSKELRPQSPWRSCEQIVQTTMPKCDKGAKISVALSNPEIVEPILTLQIKRKSPAFFVK